MAMRNGWNLWGVQKDKPTTLRDHIVERFGVSHGDDLSGMVLKGVSAKLNGFEYNPNAAAQYYIDYWAKQGLEPNGEKKKGLIAKLVRSCGGKK
jgi:hypothetical protein